VVANVPPRRRIENLSLRQLERHLGEPSNPSVLGTCPPTTSFQMPRIGWCCARQSRLRDWREMSLDVRPEHSDKMSLTPG
jgi:hypothetical protein